MLHRLIAYVNSPLDVHMVAYVGDRAGRLDVMLFADAYFAGDKDTSRSTSGIFSCVKGPNTCVPISGISKKQGCVSRSAPEAEVVAMEHAVRAEGFPLLPLFDMVLARKCQLRVREDN